MTDQEREDFRQCNGRMINDLCALGEKIVDAAMPRKTAAENAGMTETQYQQAEALYLYGDLSGRE